MKPLYFDLNFFKLMKTGVADLPLHYGKAPKWLFSKMVKLSKSICEIIVLEYREKELLKRISDPFWFQAFSCVLGYDWHSSGCSTVTMGALKEALKDCGLGIKIAGGKGRASRKTPEEIIQIGNEFGLSGRKIEKLIRTSRLVAKVDNNALQDGYTLYHHSFVITENGRWCVVQQGMNPSVKYARRYHWYCYGFECFVEEPHSGIFCAREEKNVLNLISKESRENRKAILDIVKENPQSMKKFFVQKNSLLKYFKMKASHTFDKRLYMNLVNLHNFSPDRFEDILMFKNVGPKTIRALAIIAKLVFGAPLVWKDTKVYSFAHGGKDGVPYPVDRATYDKTIETLRDAIKNAEIEKRDKLTTLRRLNAVFNF